MELRGKQKRFLRAQAHSLRPMFSVGKEGLTENWLNQLSGALDKRELIKVNILQNADVTTKQVQQFIEDNTNIQVVQVIGHVLVLFMVSHDESMRRLSETVSAI
ncbi:ribosome assembly RNA-binding protein YhbY [Paucilactobacillus kaifaensis]|uniref:ribosome assembly RNA-binding protein YhbY n=1 Tax=Paucilactobacillus kaifaensis TaxID=2559921 RepID=UPI0010F9ACBC|nr:ribosome assembly RNA-binding protein YhbY [Paucilactobacillus kaifaensis]